MIKLIEDNDVLKAINLGDKFYKTGGHHAQDINELSWINYFISLVSEQKKGNPHVLVIGDYVNGELIGFLSAESFLNVYSSKYTMEVKDCIINPDCNNVFTITRLFNYMIKHIRDNGGSSWVASSPSVGKISTDYENFLLKKYNAEKYILVKGVVKENEDETI
jgi:hypothetical protein